jgi:hypothetical protein
MDKSGLPAHDIDKHNRLLVHTYVEENEGDECISVAEHIAEEGHMFPIQDGGLNWECVRSNGSRNRHVLVLSSFQMKPDSSHTSLPIPQQLNIEIINIREIAVL